MHLLQMDQWKHILNPSFPQAKKLNIQYCCIAGFPPNNVYFYWLLIGHMKFNNKTVPPLALPANLAFTFWLAKLAFWEWMSYFSEITFQEVEGKIIHSKSFLPHMPNIFIVTEQIISI